MANRSGSSFQVQPVRISADVVARVDELKRRGRWSRGAEGQLAQALVHGYSALPASSLPPAAPPDRRLPHVAVPADGPRPADALTGIALIGAVDDDVASVTADPAYDTIAFYAVTRAWCESRRSAGQDGAAVSPQTEVDGTRSHDPKNHQDGAAPMEEGGRLPSSGRRGECLLPVTRRFSATVYEPERQLDRRPKRCLRATC